MGVTGRRRVITPLCKTVFEALSVVLESVSDEFRGLRSTLAWVGLI